MSSRLVGFLSVVALVVFAGCGGGSASVTGKVTANGDPLTSGKVVFSPIGGGVKAAAGKIQNDGTYELKTAGDEGIWPAEYRVMYSPATPQEEAKWESWSISPEKVTVESGPNEIVIELTK